MSNLVILEDPVADALDDLAALGKHWVRNRKEGRMSSGIRNAMLLVAQEAVTLLGVDAASAPSTTTPRLRWASHRDGWVCVSHTSARGYLGYGDTPKLAYAAWLGCQGRP